MVEMKRRLAHFTFGLALVFAKLWRNIATVLYAVSTATACSQRWLTGANRWPSLKLYSRCAGADSRPGGSWFCALIWLMPSSS
jgi:hypothetical protein